MLPEEPMPEARPTAAVAGLRGQAVHQDPRHPALTSTYAQGRAVRRRQQQNGNWNILWMQSNVI